MSVDVSLEEFLEAVTPSSAEKRLGLGEIDRLCRENEQLRVALVSRATIDQAKGIVMALERCNPEEAFQALVRMSQNSNVPLRSVASGLVYSASGQD